MGNWAEYQVICPTCIGSGEVVPPHDVQNPNPSSVPCPSCDGEGYKEHGRVKIKAILDAIAELTH